MLQKTLFPPGLPPLVYTGSITPSTCQNGSDHCSLFSTLLPHISINTPINRASTTSPERTELVVRKFFLIFNQHFSLLNFHHIAPPFPLSHHSNQFLSFLGVYILQTLAGYIPPSDSPFIHTYLLHLYSSVIPHQSQVMMSGTIAFSVYKTLTKRYLLKPYFPDKPFHLDLKEKSTSSPHRSEIIGDVLFI